MRIPNQVLVILLDLWLELRYRLTSQLHRLPRADDPGFVVCMTSYPARIRFAWLSLESLFRQTDKAFKLVLVLAINQFPSRKIPGRIRRMEKRGLDILWVSRDGGSFDHLWPAYTKYPSSSIISVDDDKFFDPGMVEKLKSASVGSPGKIIGWRGWQMRLVHGHIGFGEGWSRAAETTPSVELFIPPGNGSLFPPRSLPPLTGDYKLREKLSPNADDVWYWAMARVIGTPSLCLAEPNHRAVWRQSGTVSLAAVQPGPKEFQQVLAHFDLEKELLRTLT